MTESHILLLPRTNYFKWVRAAQKYALSFGVNITPDPLKAGTKKVVTVVIPEDGYPTEGDIIIWIKARFTETAVDAIIANSPDELKNILDRRVANNQRYGGEERVGTQDILPRYPLDRLYLFWPTDYATISQRFAANPEIYGKFGLPGHEGVDIRAPMNTNVYACADGEVFYVETDPDKHAYGKHIRIRHVNGFKTVYGHLAEVLVSVGQQVKPRELIGKADSTGNSTGSHLHLTLKKEDATKNGDTNFKGDIIDPTPYLVYPHQEAEVAAALGITIKPFQQITYPWARPCLVGLNGRVDGTIQEVDFNIARTAGIEAIKIPVNTPESTISKLTQMIPELFIMARIYHPLGTEPVSPEDWLAEMQSEVNRLYELGVCFFEIHQSPNLQIYGWNHSWQSGSSFAAWWLKIVSGLREAAPEARFGFPGLSPGAQVSGQRMDARVFLDQADEALTLADWIGVNCFWSGETEMNMEHGGRFYLYYRERFPEKLLFVTEFGNVNELTNAYVKGQEYVKYYELLRNQPGIGAAFAQVMSAASGYGSLTWRDEDGNLNKIPYLVGRRQF